MVAHRAVKNAQASVLFVKHGNAKEVTLSSLLVLILIYVIAFGEMAVAKDVPAYDGMQSNLQNLDERISKLEQSIFGVGSEQRPTLVRLEALEMRVFDKVQAGTLMMRLANLEARVGQMGKFGDASAPAKAQTAEVSGSGSGVNAGTKSVPKRVLKAEVAEGQILEYGIELGERRTDESHVVHFVKNVLRGSRAEQSGILAGDIVRDVRTNQSATLITIERGGKLYCADLSRNRQLASATTPDRSRSEILKAGSTLKSSQAGAYLNDHQSAIAPTLSPIGRFVGHLRQMKGMVREFPYSVYDMLAGEDGAEVTTEFHPSPEGLLTGTYSVKLGPPYESFSGTIDNVQLLAAGQLFCQWNDKNGTGYIVFEFNSDFSSFQGFWSPDVSSYSRKFGSPSPIQYPTPDQVKLYGFTHDGVRKGI